MKVEEKEVYIYNSSDNKRYVFGSLAEVIQKLDEDKAEDNTGIYEIEKDIWNLLKIMSEMKSSLDEDQIAKVLQMIADVIAVLKGYDPETKPIEVKTNPTS